ncbi:hypothetical protein HMPREF1395_00897 [Helicobacter pylori GAM112Ai]|nr:hypothetical protein HMPREF1395_00897 [Helicobacter pylori GAM112Ai]
MGGVGSVLPLSWAILGSEAPCGVFVLGLAVFSKATPQPK